MREDDVMCDNITLEEKKRMEMRADEMRLALLTPEGKSNIIQQRNILQIKTHNCDSRADNQAKNIYG